MNTKNKHASKSRKALWSCPFASYVWYLACFVCYKCCTLPIRDTEATNYAFLSQQNSIGFRLTIEMGLKYVDYLEMRLEKQNLVTIVRKKKQANSYRIHQLFHLQSRLLLNGPKFFQPLQPLCWLGRFQLEQLYWILRQPNLPCAVSVAAAAAITLQNLVSTSLHRIDMG